jgi:hypothetical protein
MLNGDSAGDDHHEIKSGKAWIFIAVSDRRKVRGKDRNDGKTRKKA